MKLTFRKLRRFVFPLSLSFHPFPDTLHPLLHKIDLMLRSSRQALSVASADYAKATKTAEAKVIREKESNIALAKARVSSLSAELAKASKKAKAEL